MKREVKRKDKKTGGVERKGKGGSFQKKLQIGTGGEWKDSCNFGEGEKGGGG